MKIIDKTTGNVLSQEKVKEVAAASIKSLASPAGYVAMPRTLTDENGAKAHLIGEFHEKVLIRCEECDGDGWLDEDAEPILVSVLASGHGDHAKYFASIGQHGWNSAQWVEDMGGHWMKAIIPEPPKQ